MNSKVLLDTFWNCGWSCSALISRSSVNLRTCARRFPEMREIYLHHFMCWPLRLLSFFRVECDVLGLKHVLQFYHMEWTCIKVLHHIMYPVRMS